MRYLLDANILSDLIRRPEGRVAKRIERESLDAVCTSIIVAAELRFGAVRKGSPRLSALIEGLLARTTSSPSKRPPTAFMPSCARGSLPLVGRSAPMICSSQPTP